MEDLNFEQLAKEFGTTSFEGKIYAFKQDVYVDTAVRAAVIDTDGTIYQATWNIARLTSDDGEDLDLDTIDYRIADNIRVL